MDHTGDGWGYACEILKGNLISGHHLLYNGFSSLWLNLFSWSHIEPIVLLSWLNVIFSTGILLILAWFFNEANISDKKQMGLLLMASGFFGIYRYSFENETYIIPLFWSLFGTYLIEYSNYKNWGWISLAIACLFHQIYIFWLFPMLISEWKINKKFKILFLVSLVILVPYCMASFQLNKNILSIVFQDVENGYINNYFSIKNTVLSMVNVFRSILEIHGRLFPLFTKSSFTGIANSIALAMLVSGTIGLIIEFRKKAIKFNYFILLLFKIPKIWILILTFAFAFWSNGNAEYMISIPIIALLIVIQRFNLERLNTNNSFLLIGLGIWIWNSVSYFLPMANDKYQVSTQSKLQLIENLLLRNKNNSQSQINYTFDTILFISREAATLHNCQDYFSIINNTHNAAKVLFVFPDDTAHLVKNRYSAMYTDLYSDQMINRAQLTYQLPLKIHCIEPALYSKYSITGTYRISKLSW